MALVQIKIKVIIFNTNTEPFTIKNDDILVDISIFSTKNKPLRTLIKHLVQKGYTIKQVAKILNRSYKNIWMINNE